MLFAVLFFELFPKLHFPLPRKNSNIKEIYRADDVSLFSLFYIWQLFAITVDVIIKCKNASFLLI
jgi:hypothetical protein